MRSETSTVDEYLLELPLGRRDAIATVRDTILENLAPGFEEAMNFGMITYHVPLGRYPDTYNGQPLLYAALASQKNYMSVYLMAVYTTQDAREVFLRRYRDTGKRLDMGKSCVRFRRLDDLPVDLIGEAIGSMDVESFIDVYEKARGKA